MERNNDLESYITSRKTKSELKQKEHEAKSKAQLIDKLKSKFKTTFIGSISAFEENFGHLWGNDKNHNDRNEQEKEMYSLWMLVRNRILDRGNVQMRAAVNELDNYTVAFNMYKLIMRTKDE